MQQLKVGKTLVLKISRCGRRQMWEKQSSRMSKDEGHVVSGRIERTMPTLWCISSTKLCTQGSYGPYFMWARDLAYLLTLIVSLNKGFRTADDTGICGSICGAVGGGIGGRIGTFGDRIGIGTYSYSLQKKHDECLWMTTSKLKPCTHFPHATTHTIQRHINR